MESRHLAGDSVLAAIRQDELVGYASFGAFRTGDGYSQTAEHSISVRGDARGLGIGAMLLNALIKEAKSRDIHDMIGGIEASNSASLALHARLGIVEAGRLPQTGRKFGRWLDLILMQTIP